MIVVGIDGADPATVFHGAENGQLPNFARMIESGGSGPLYSVTTSSAGAWTSHLTGVNPDRSGVITFIVDGEDRFAQTSDINVETYPEYLDEEDISVGCLNLPLTYPPLELDNGFSVSGQLTPLDADDFAYPSKVRDQLKQLGYRIDFQFFDRRYGFIDDNIVADISPETLVEEALDVMERRVRTSKRLLKEENNDLFVTLFKDTDSLQHYFWQCVTDDGLEDPLLECYELIDNFIGHILDEYPERNVLVFSDHGFRSFNRGEGAIADFYEDRLIPVASNLIPYSVKRNRWFAKFHYTAERAFTYFSDTSETLHTGEHHPVGVWLLSGPDGISVDEQDLGFLDLPPLVLYLLNIPIPEAYEGTVPTNVTSLEREPRFVDRDIEVDRERREIDDLTVKNLEELGYIEAFEGRTVEDNHDEVEG